MDYASLGTRSLWMDGPDAPLDPLCESTTADVAIVGAGVAGLSVAYGLAARGQSVVVLDDGPVGGGETSRSTAHLVTALDRRYFTIERMHGAPAAAFLAEAHIAAIGRIEEIIADEGIDCEFMRIAGYLMLPVNRRRDARQLADAEYSAATRAGVRCTFLERAPSLEIDTGPCLEFPDQAQFHPLHYLHGLSRAVTRLGGRVFTGSHVHTVRGGPNAHVVTTGGYRVSVGAVVVATNTPVNDLVTMHTKQAACRTYVLGLHVPRGILQPALYWDGYWDDHEQPYHYVRLAMDPRSHQQVLIVGGEDHQTGRAENHAFRFELLRRWVQAMFPMVGPVVFRWSGQIMEPHDELAYIGRNPGDEDNVYIITGDSGNGLTYAAIAGMMLPDLIEGQPHRWSGLFSPGRLPGGAVGTAVVEAAKMAGCYGDWLTLHPRRQLDQMVPGDGVVVRINGELQACYKGPSGQVLQRSAICPHLHGIVRWNASEHTWDCPCHGSRFTCDGRVICGPANADLADIRERTAQRSGS